MQALPTLNLREGSVEQKREEIKKKIEECARLAVEKFNKTE